MTPKFLISEQNRNDMKTPRAAVSVPVQSSSS